MNTAVVALQSWDEIQTDVAEYWYIYLSMPLVAALIGYVTKLVVLEMLYRPLEFKGVGPIGWQGIVPRRAGRVAAVTIDLLTEQVLRPEEMLESVDARKAIAEVRGPLENIVDDIARDVADALRPGLWASLPERTRKRILAVVHERAPIAIDNLLAEMRTDLDRVIDIRLLAITTLVRNKEKLNNLMRNTAGGAMAFVRRSGIYFGIGIGIVQMVAWAVIHNVWIMPIFGLITGFASDWLALNMLFLPLRPRRILGVRVHGILHAERDDITRNYARIMATDLFAPEALLQAVLTGPGSDRLFALVEREIMTAIDEGGGFVTQLAALAAGTRRYDALKETVARRATAELPRVADSIAAFAGDKMDLENILVEKMSQLSPEQFEAIMRPVFKDDEFLMLVVGAALGFLVGELQVEIVTHLTSG